MKHKKIYLTGFMACGKSTLGRAVSEATRLRFADLDRLIEAEAGCSVKEFFDHHGAEAFRSLETEVLNRLASNDVADIIACGGGTPCSRENLHVMGKSGIVIWLQASVATIIRRMLDANPDQRPVIKPYIEDAERLEKFVSTLLAERQVWYRRADAVFNADRLDTAAEIEATTSLFIDRFLR